MIFVAAMVPRPGESPGDWWANTGHPPEVFGRSPEDLFLHDVPADVAAESAGHVREQSGTPFEKPWPLDRWPNVPTRFLLCRDDRFFPADFQRRVVKDRLGFAPDEMDGGHLPALARPEELASRLLGYLAT
jgi:pimeloyl-ACP methyl ester carboxylesterase